MPIYEYVCTGCRLEEEVLVRGSAAGDGRLCPTCGRPMERKVSLPGTVIFNGTGYYTTDYKRKDGSSSPARAASGAPDAGGKPDGKGDGKPGAPAAPSAKEGSAPAAPPAAAAPASPSPSPSPSAPPPAAGGEKKRA